MSEPEATQPAGIGAVSAMLLVFASSAAVLVVEITALRLLAPYFGLSLETSTLVIGLALAAIAAGSWAGGRIADRVDPRRLMAPALAISGAVVAITPALLRTVAETEPGALLPAATLSIVVPGALLSAITPMVTKLRLTDLHETGSVVGRLSGIGTLGAIMGTVLTGFVLISHLPVSRILLGLGVLLVGIAAALGWHSRQGRSTAAAAAVVVATGGLANAVAPGGCDVETRYHCAIVDTGGTRESGRTLVLDGVRNSYVDLADPTYLEFSYIRAFAAAIDATWPTAQPLEAYHLGAGGLTLPHFLADQRPGTSSLVSEIDPGVVAIDTERLGYRPSPELRVRVEDGRRGLARLGTDSQDLIIGDAFSGASVPWHLTTREAVQEIRRVLRPEGTYLMNLIDHGELAFVRAEIATLQETFDQVVLLGEPVDLGLLPGAMADGGNMVVLATDRELDLAAIRATLRERETGWTTLSGRLLRVWVGEAEVLTDDHAPVDQLLVP